MPEYNIKDVYLACDSIKLQLDRCYNNFKRKNLPQEALEQCETLRKEYQGCVLYHLDKLGFIKI